MSLPSYVAAGTVAAGAGDVVPGLPAGWQQEDIFLLVVQSNNQAITAPSGWTEVINSPQSNGSAGPTVGATRLAAFWRRATASESAPTVTDTGDHTLARIAAFRECTTSGNPWDVGSGGNEVADTSLSASGATTTEADCLVVVMAAHAFDTTSTAFWDAWTNGNLANLVERFENSTSQGNGGGIVLTTGEKAAAGAYGSTTATLSVSSRKAWITLALKGESATLVSGSDSGSGSDTATLVASSAATDTGSGAEMASIEQALLAAADIGQGSDLAALAYLSAVSDIGAGMDNATLLAALVGEDVGAGMDQAQAPTAAIAASDTGSGFDVGSLTAFIQREDAGAGIEATTLSALIAASDQGVGIDLAMPMLLVVASDSGAGTDLAVIEAHISSGDTGTSSEQANITALLSALDAALGSEASGIIAVIQAEDSGLGFDIAVVDVELVMVFASDSGSGSDSATLTAALAASDQGSSIETAAPSADINAADTATGNESANLIASLHAGDQGLGTEIAALVVSLLAMEFGTSTETAFTILSLHVHDAGVGADQASLAANLLSEDVYELTVNESANLVVMLTLVDIGEGIDDSSVIRPFILYGPGRQGRIARQTGRIDEIHPGDVETGQGEHGGVVGSDVGRIEDNQ